MRFQFEYYPAESASCIEDSIAGYKSLVSEGDLPLALWDYLSIDIYHTFLSHIVCLLLSSCYGLSEKSAALLWKLLNLNKCVLNVLIAGVFSWKVTISIDCGLRLKMHALPTLYQDVQSNITPSRASGLFFIVS